MTDGLSNKEVLRLIAFAVSGIEVGGGAESGIKNLNWGRLFEEGLCLPLDDGQLGIPYCLFRLAAKFDLNFPGPWQKNVCFRTCVIFVSMSTMYCLITSPGNCGKNSVLVFLLCA